MCINMRLQRRLETEKKAYQPKLFEGTLYCEPFRMECWGCGSKTRNSICIYNVGIELLECTIDQK